MGFFTKKNILLVHGAWHGAWCYYKIKAILEDFGHNVKVLDLPSHGISKLQPNAISLNDYVNAIKDKIDEFPINEKVIIVGHSMGGIPTSQFTENFTEKVEKVVYLSAFMLQNGENLVQIATQDSDSLVTPNLIIDEENGTVDINRNFLEEMFYDRSNDADIELAKTTLVVNPLLPFVTPVSLTEGNYGSVDKYYISCLQDKAISPTTQASMYNKYNLKELFTINTDHSAFFSKPIKLAVILNKIARD